jgi:hypothetical protein
MGFSPGKGQSIIGFVGRGFSCDIKESANAGLQSLMAATWID